MPKSGRSGSQPKDSEQELGIGQSHAASATTPTEQQLRDRVQSQQRELERLQKLLAEHGKATIQPPEAGPSVDRMDVEEEEAEEAEQEGANQPLAEQSNPMY